MKHLAAALAIAAFAGCATIGENGAQGTVLTVRYYPTETGFVCVSEYDGERTVFEFNVDGSWTLPEKEEK